MVRHQAYYQRNHFEVTPTPHPQGLPVSIRSESYIKAPVLDRLQIGERARVLGEANHPLGYEFYYISKETPDGGEVRGFVWMGVVSKTKVPRSSGHGLRTSQAITARNSISSSLTQQGHRMLHQTGIVPIDWLRVGTYAIRATVRVALAAVKAVAGDVFGAVQDGFAATANTFNMIKAMSVSNRKKINSSTRPGIRGEVQDVALHLLENCPEC